MPSVAANILHAVYPGMLLLRVARFIEKYFLEADHITRVD